MKISSSKIKIADLRYFVEGSGLELTDSQSKIILVDYSENNDYVNPFCFEERYPVFKRSPFSNVTLSGLVYGTRMYHISNNLVTGPCWLLSSESFRKVSGKEAVSLEELEDFVLSSPDFYKDRIAIAQSRIGKRKQPFRMSRIVEKDEPLICAMNDFFSEREIGIQKVKED